MMRDEEPGIQEDGAGGSAELTVMTSNRLGPRCRTKTQSGS